MIIDMLSITRNHKKNMIIDNLSITRTHKKNMIIVILGKDSFEKKKVVNFHNWVGGSSQNVDIFTTFLHVFVHE